MRTTMLTAATAIALLPLFAGCCSQTGQIARGQAPATAPAPDSVAPDSVAPDSVVTAPAAGDPMVGDDECYDDDDCDGMRAGGHFGKHGCYGSCGVPYHVPHDFVFPQAGPPAVVQYPYYTCKGPDCFFLQK